MAWQPLATTDSIYEYYKCKKELHEVLMIGNRVARLVKEILLLLEISMCIIIRYLTKKKKSCTPWLKVGYPQKKKVRMRVNIVGYFHA